MSGGVGRLAPGLVVALILAAAGPAVAAPDGCNMPAGVLEELEAFVTAQWNNGARVPGLAYEVVQGDQVVLARALGVRRLGGEPVTTDTVFEIASTTKAFTASMLAMLVEEGKLTWDDRVVDRLPSFAMHDPWVTRELRVADLVCQRSGMPAYSLDNMPFLGFDREAYTRAVRFVAPVASFRSTYAYQNNLWIVAGELIERLTGLTYEDNLDRRIFGPLGMASSTANPEVVAAMPDTASGHIWQADGTLALQPADFPYRNAINICAAAGGIRSTVTDLARWLRLHINLGEVDGTRLLEATSVAYLHAPKSLIVDGSTPSVNGDVLSYASGWLFMTVGRHPVVWHNGGAPGMHSIVGFIPEAGVGLVMLTNEPNNQIPEAALGKLAALVLAPSPASASALAVMSRRDTPGQAAGRAEVVPMGPPLPLERYVGSYTNPAYGVFEVRVEDGRLEMVFGPNRIVGRLEPVSGNTFRMQWPAWAELVSTVTFTVPSGRPAERMNVSLFEDVDGGAFVRASGDAGHRARQHLRRGQ